MKLLVGKIVKAQGIKGEVKIRSYLDNGSLFKTFKYLYIGETRAAVRSARYNDGFAYVGFTAIVDRNQAEALRNMDIFADRDQIELDKYSFFIDDMIGAEISLDDGTIVGKVKGIMPNKAAADILVIDNGESETMIPFLKEMIVDADIENKRLVLSSKRYAEVSVYDE